MGMTMTNAMKADDSGQKKLLAPLSCNASARAPEILGAIGEAELLSITEKSMRKGMMTISVQARMPGLAVPFSVRWVCSLDKDTIVLLQLNDRTLEPESGIPQLIARIKSADQLETLQLRELEPAIRSMNRDLLAASNLSGLEWNARFTAACRSAFTLTDEETGSH